MSSPVPFADGVALLTGAALGYPIALPNAVFVKPQPPAPWLRVEVMSHMLAPIDIGANVWQEDGTTFIDIIVPANSGTTLARTIAKNAANAFRNLGPRPVVYTAGSLTAGVAGPDGMWWTLTFSMDWTYQDTT
jgi:hypothetical protein